MSKKAAKGLKDIGKLDPFDLSGRRAKREARGESHAATQAASAASAEALAKQQEEADKLASDKKKQNKITQDEELEQARRNAISETMRKEGAPTSNRRFLKGAK